MAKDDDEAEAPGLGLSIFAAVVLLLTLYAIYGHLSYP
jgi:hypothetical protein